MSIVNPIDGVMYS